MTRHTQRQIKMDDLTFPVRIKVKVPERGLGNRLGEMIGWMNKVIGHEKSAWHSTTARYTQACAVYFCDLEAANAFFAEFPELELADGRQVRR